MVVNEIFYSLQGEGFLTGVPSIFVRLAGCPLRCKWCDTKYAWDENAGQKMTTAEIIKRIQNWTCSNVVITGGEPMLNPDLSELARQLKASGKHITIETAGVKYIPDLPCDLMSISPKLSNSMSGNRERDDGLKPILQIVDNYNYQIKFVVDSPDDLDEIQQTLRKIPNIDLSKVMLMPQAVTRDELIQKSLMVAELCKQTGFTFCQRLHILLWDNKTGK